MYIVIYSQELQTKKQAVISTDPPASGHCFSRYIIYSTGDLLSVSGRHLLSPNAGLRGLLLFYLFSESVNLCHILCFSTYTEVKWILHIEELLVLAKTQVCYVSVLRQRRESTKCTKNLGIC